MWLENVWFLGLLAAVTLISYETKNSKAIALSPKYHAKKQPEPHSNVTIKTTQDHFLVTESLLFNDDIEEITDYLNPAFFNVDWCPFIPLFEKENGKSAKRNLTDFFNLDWCPVDEADITTKPGKSTQ